MLRLILHLFIGATLSGTAIVVTLIAGATSFWWLIGVATLGFLLAFPLSALIAKKLTSTE